MKLEIVFVVFAVSYVDLLPPAFKRCNRKDPNFKKCYFDAAQFGVTLLTKPYRTMDLPSMEPLEVAELTVPGSQGVVAVDQKFKNCKLYGLTAAKFERFELNLEKNELDVVGTIPNLVLKCDYQLNGRILLLTIQGEGKSTVVLDKFHLSFHAKYEKMKKQGKTYYKNVSNKLSSQPEHVSFYFENLFNGNKELGENINAVMNDNWKEIWSDVSEGYNKAVENIMSQVVDKLWTKVSLEEFFD